MDFGDLGEWDARNAAAAAASGARALEPTAWLADASEVGVSGARELAKGPVGVGVMAGVVAAIRRVTGKQVLPIWYQQIRSNLQSLSARSISGGQAKGEVSHNGGPSALVADTTPSVRLLVVTTWPAWKRPRRTLLAVQSRRALYAVIQYIVLVLRTACAHDCDSAGSV